MRRLIGIVLAVSVTGMGAPTVAGAAESTDCPAVIWLSARGSGEGYASADASVTSAQEAFEETLPDHVDVATHELHYPALSIWNFFRDVATFGEDFYFDGIEQGVTAAVDFLTEQHSRCRDNTLFALAGYSQGAIVMQRAVASIRLASLREKISAVALLGNPLRFGANSYNRGTASSRYDGVAAGVYPSSVIPANIAKVTRDWCLARDVVCEHRPNQWRSVLEQMARRSGAAHFWKAVEVHLSGYITDRHNTARQAGTTAAMSTLDALDDLHSAPPPPDPDQNPPTPPPPHPDAQARISTGADHSCSVRPDLTVRCWGINQYGRLGDGTTENRSTPVQVVGLADVAAVDAGAAHTCALRTDGLVYCWGLNIYGQLGNGGSWYDQPTPVQVEGLTDVVGIAAGAYHTCATRRDGTAYCWGYNFAGALGDGTTVNRSTPQQVTALTGVVALSAGRDHTCAVGSDGTSHCWGYNYYGQLGDGTTLNRLTPQQVTGLTGVTTVSAGKLYTCAVADDSSARCWGYNGRGQLGDGTTTDRLTPTPVAAVTGFATVSAGGSAGGYHTCGLATDGTGYCWGGNSGGQLGDGTTESRSTPGRVTDLSGVAAISAGGHHSCGVLDDSSVYCWGHNGYGQLGDGTTNSSSTPVRVEST